MAILAFYTLLRFRILFPFTSLLLLILSKRRTIPGENDVVAVYILRIRCVSEANLFIDYVA